jgi:ferric-dicitrate binding protein FerR (iron transport regulator)
MDDADSLIARFLAGTTTREESINLARWREERAEHEAHFRNMEALWIHSGIETESFEPDATLALEKIHARINKRTSAAGHRRGRFYYMKWAAVLIMTIGVGLAAYIRYTDNTVEVVTAEDNTKELLLADGSKVWLNGSSKIRYKEHFDTQRREVYLEGEAYFEVAKDQSRPFIIRAHHSTTEVLGTSFNVRAPLADDKVVVTVNSGKVSLYGARPAEKVMLVKGDRGVFSIQAGQVIKARNTDRNFISWKTGKIVFDNTPFDTVAAVLSRHYRKAITIERPMAGCRLTSTFEHQPLAGILEELAAMMSIVVKEEGNTIVLSGAGC